MRRIVLATAATLALLAAGSFAPNRAEAMTVTTPSGLMAAIDGTNLAENIAYVCRRVWRCGPLWLRLAPRAAGGRVAAPTITAAARYYGRWYYNRRYWW